MTALYIEETWLNATEGHGIGESGVYESAYEANERGKLYRALQREYGRCVGRVYVDRVDGSAMPIGWVFLQRQRYEDTHEPYLRETWVSVHTAPPTIVRTAHYLDFRQRGDA